MNEKKLEISTNHQMQNIIALKKHLYETYSNQEIYDILCQQKTKLLELIQNASIKNQDIPKLQSLVIDDEETTQIYMKGTLEQIGICKIANYNHDELKTAYYGLNLMLESLRNNPYHLVFIDYDIPTMNGIELILEYLTYKSIKKFCLLDLPRLIIFTAKYKNAQCKKIINQIIQIPGIVFLDKHNKSLDDILNLLSENPDNILSRFDNSWINKSNHIN